MNQTRATWGDRCFIDENKLSLAVILTATAPCLATAAFYLIARLAQTPKDTSLARGEYFLRLSALASSQYSQLHWFPSPCSQHPAKQYLRGGLRVWSLRRRAMHVTREAFQRDRWRYSPMIHLLGKIWLLALSLCIVYKDLNINHE